MNNMVPNPAPELDFNTPAAARLRKFRRFQDKFTTGAVGVGGISVVIAIMLIFVYLLYEVMPLFESASIEPWQHEGSAVVAYTPPGAEQTLHLSLEEQNEIAMRLDAAGQASYFRAESGELVKQFEAGLSEAPIAAFSISSESSGTFALAHTDNSLSVRQTKYKITYPNDVRKIDPQLLAPYGDVPLELNPGLGEAAHLAFRDTEDALGAVVLDKSGQLAFSRYNKEENFITEEVELTTEHFTLPALPNVQELLLSYDLRWLFVSGQKTITMIDLAKADEPIVHEPIDVTEGSIVSFRLLLGGNSVMITDDQGVVTQWFLIRDDNNDYSLQRIRQFESPAFGQTPTVMTTEQRRKGFLIATDGGVVSFYNSTAHNRVLATKIIDQEVENIAISPRANALLVEGSNGLLSYWKVNNEHPEVSMSALWSKVWYEGYQEPEFIWQSSAATNDFEPKYSLMPLAFGTLKAAFYAMLLATPLAICGAIYTAYFMAPSLRRKIKPFIELMEALPTVILGFLAGLWLAPYVETNLITIFTILLVIPIGVLVFAFAWQQMPARIRFFVPDGWDAALLIPVIILLALFCIPFSEALESVLFGGDMRTFVTNDLGISFDQRNALVVGLAMGFAVIPTIFSITEDAIFSVPKHLSNGSLALGATDWQTLTRVILPTASPGIFSAVMIGMGRAVGETMIVLMATGNTPIMDMNIFEGMRTLAANIAVEMPESEVGSSHYRILFLAALVLFSFTFIVNTVAEVVRQRLRRKYGSL